MHDRLKNALVENWRRLVAAAAAAVLLFAGAYLLDRTPNSADTASEGPEEAASIPQPLADTELGKTVDAILADDSYQRTLPDTPQPTRRQSAAMPEWLTKLFLYGLLAMGVFAVAVFIWVLVTGASGARPLSPAVRAIKAKGSPAPAAQHSLMQPSSLKDAERLAAEGHYGEAVRILLAVALTQLSGRNLVRIRPSMTGREIVRGATLVNEALDALQALVAIVEASAFAGHPVSKDDFERALAQFDCLARVEGRAA